LYVRYSSFSCGAAALIGSYMGLNMQIGETKIKYKFDGDKTVIEVIKA
jgi:hypothetical protein